MQPSLCESETCSGDTASDAHEGKMTHFPGEGLFDKRQRHCREMSSALTAVTPPVLHELNQCV